MAQKTKRAVKNSSRQNGGQARSVSARLADRPAIKNVRKRDGRIVTFNVMRIASAIGKAFEATQEGNERTALALARTVEKKLAKLIQKGRIKSVPNIEDIQDLVEEALIEKDFAKSAKAYILYRQKRAEIRREKQKILNKEEIDEVDKQFDINALKVLCSRYLRKNEKGEVTESPKELFTRVAVHTALPDLLYDEKVFRKNNAQPIASEDVPVSEIEHLEGKVSIGSYKLNRFHLVALKRVFNRMTKIGQMKISWQKFLALLEDGYFDKYEKTVERFYELMVSRKFLPNTPAIANFGSHLGMGSACFVLDIEDSMSKIMDTMKDGALIHKAGGGIGINFSKLRPEGDFVQTTSGISSGPVSFMRILDAITAEMKQGGIRRGANMGILNSNHPDIETFITAKDGNKALRNFNISVLMMPDFWAYYETDKPYPLVNPRTGEAVRYISSRALFDRIVYQAWESAEPGVIFYDHVNRHNPFFKHLGPIVTTNPCVSGDTMVVTERGLERIDSMKPGKIVVDGRAVHQAQHDLVRVGEKNAVRVMTRWQKEKTLPERGVRIGEAQSVFKTGVKDVFNLQTHSGYEIKATSDHKFLTPSGWQELGDLKSRDRVFIQSGAGKWGNSVEIPFEVQNMIVGKNGRFYEFNLPTKWSHELGQVVGWLTGDGWLSRRHHAVGWVFARHDYEVQKKFQPVLERYFNRKIDPLETSSGVWQLRSASAVVVNFFLKLGVKDASEEREVPHALFTAPRDAVVGFIEGLFSSDGTIASSSRSRNYIRLNSSSRTMLKQVQLLLLNFGIQSTVYDRSTEPKTFRYKNKNGKSLTYKTSGVNYELNISKESIVRFAETFEFIQEDRNEKSLKITKSFSFYRDYFLEEVKRISYVGKEEVWDLTESETHSFLGNGFVVKNCGEVLLYPNESCNLGSINVWAFVDEEHRNKKTIDWNSFAQAIRDSSHFLDNVIDISRHPLPAIEVISLCTRKIGLGIMGLGDLLYELHAQFNSPEGFSLMEEIAEFLNYHSKLESVELAKTRGAIPYLDKSFYPEGKLPFAGFYDKSSWHFDWEKVSQDVKHRGIRNGYTTVIAPTGSISMIAGCSSGIEPVFALVFEKNVSVGSFYYIDPVFEETMIKEGLFDEDLVRDVAAQKGSVARVPYIPPRLKKVFVTAYDITPEDHIRTLAAFQKWVDSSISKTNNFPAHATTEDIKKSYVLAYQLGCKDVTVFRDTSIKDQVLVSGDGVGKKDHKKKSAGVTLSSLSDEKAQGLRVYQRAGVSGVTEGVQAVSVGVATMVQNEQNGKIRLCPQCSTSLAFHEGCTSCPACGWGMCA